MKNEILMRFKKFEDIEAWQLARKLDKTIYDCYQNNKFSYDYVLKNQIAKACGSITDNIAEGYERNGNKEFIQFLSIAKASCGEVRSQLYRAYDRNYIDKSKFEELKKQTEIISVKISKLIKYLISSNKKGVKYLTS